MTAPGAPPGFRGEFWVDETRRAGFAEHSGILRSVPRAVAVPRDAPDVAAVARWAWEGRVPLVPRGAGTGMPGGSVGPGVAVDLATRFRRTRLMDPGRRIARVEPGVTLAELNAEAAAHRLHFPVDPSSAERATFGGMIANNSGGAHTVRYGATRAWVQALEVVLADGTRCSVRRGERATGALAGILREVDAALSPRDAVVAGWPRVRKNSSGYALREYLESGDALDLLVGSEGTLAMVLSAELRLAPVPAARGLALVEFTELEAAGAAVRRILELHPATCEIIDRTFIDLVRSGGGDHGFPLRGGLEAILFVEMEGDTDAD